MPSANPITTFSFDIKDNDVERALYELRKTDQDLFNQMRRELRSDIKPIAQRLHARIPRGGSPLSGMSGSQRIAKTSQTPDQRSPFVWKLPRTSIDVESRRRGRRGTQPIVRIRFTDKRPYSAFSILETARQAQSYRGANMIAGIERKYQKDGKGRWVIQPFYEQRDEIMRMVRRIVARYTRQVNRRLARRVGDV